MPLEQLFRRVLRNGRDEVDGVNDRRRFPEIGAQVAKERLRERSVSKRLKRRFFRVDPPRDEPNIALRRAPGERRLFDRFFLNRFQSGARFVQNRLFGFLRLDDERFGRPTQRRGSKRRRGRSSRLRDFDQRRAEIAGFLEVARQRRPGVNGERRTARNRFANATSAERPISNRVALQRFVRKLTVKNADRVKVVRAFDRLDAAARRDARLPPARPEKSRDRNAFANEERLLDRSDRENANVFREAERGRDDVRRVVFPGGPINRDLFRREPFELLDQKEEPPRPGFARRKQVAAQNDEVDLFLKRRRDQPLDRDAGRVENRAFKALRTFRKTVDRKFQTEIRRVYKSKGLRRHSAALPSGILQVLAVFAIKRNIGANARFLGSTTDIPPFTIVPQNRLKRNLFCSEIAKISRSQPQKKQEMPVLTVARQTGVVPTPTKAPNVGKICIATFRETATFRQASPTLTPTTRPAFPPLFRQVGDLFRRKRPSENPRADDRALKERRSLAVFANVGADAKRLELFVGRVR